MKNREVAAQPVVEAIVGEAVVDGVSSEVEMHDPVDDPVRHLPFLRRHAGLRSNSRTRVLMASVTLITIHRSPNRQLGTDLGLTAGARPDENHRLNGVIRLTSAGFRARFRIWSFVSGALSNKRTCAGICR